ncbi:hypothetical protein F4778DRAFT_225841 [Xylariomycetidae sp. FL2044]|nr:hypothetical protein F4778DRAFT_225841 [Xylariomycetidae sp. FL2044]
MGLFKSPSTAGRVRTSQAGESGQPRHPSIRDRNISAPIPMDDEFPMRNPGTGIAHEGHPREPTNQPPPPPSHHQSRSQSQQQLESLPEGEATAVSRDTPSDVGRGDKTRSVANSGPSAASNTSSSPHYRRTARSSTLRYSTVSDGTDSNRPDSSRPQRKKSTLKSAIGKLFGRKKKPSEASISEVDYGGPESHHRSDPSALNRIEPKESEPKRSTSLPITEFDRALRSHSVGPDDIIAIESARNSLQGDPWVHRKRAATTSTRVLMARRKVFGDDMLGLSPRPASVHGRDSQTFGDEDPGSEIGRAVSSDMFPRRRSRSLSQLPDIIMATAADGPERKRSDEIRYWRESYDPGITSPVSSSAAHPEHAGDLDGEQAAAPGILGAAAASAAELPPKTPPQPFNFAPMIGMKITEAASLEDRMGTLEVQHQKIEKVVSQLFQIVSGVAENPASPVAAAMVVPERSPPPVVPRAPSAAAYTTADSSSIYQATATTSHQDFEPSLRYGGSSVSRRPSNESFGECHTFIGSIPPSTRPDDARPTSTVTVRGAASLPTLLPPRGGDGGSSGGALLTVDHYTTLKALLDTERAAREALESQVTKLSHQVSVMSSRHHYRHRPDEPLDPASTTAAYSVFDHDDDDDEDDEDLDVDTESEAFKTPREEGMPQSHFGAFGEELRVQEEDGSRKKAARTLSLSQLTLGKPKVVSATQKHQQKHQQQPVDL